MSNDKFNWKSLFVNDTEGASNIDKKESKPSFPETSTNTNTKFTAKTVTSSSQNIDSNKEVNNSTLNAIVEMYESGFDSLNVPGYDFYEFFKAIKAVNSNDPAIYKMAMTMAQGVDSKVTKDNLLKGSDFYITEINKVHQKYSQKGNTKKDEILGNQKKEKETLSSEVTQLEKKIIDLQTQLSQKKIKLEAADNNLLSEVAEIDQKIVSNDMAKDKILNTIQGVITGIKNNL